MTQLRLIQNFQGLRAIVVAPVMPEPLQAGLARLGLLVEQVPEHDAARFRTDLFAERDVVIIDGDAGAPAALVAVLGEQRLPVPVIGMVGMEAPSRLRMLMDAGATAFLRKPVHGGSVYSSLFLGINAFRRRQHAEERLADHEKRRRGRRHVIKAILHMMQREAIDDDAAYEMLRRAAMRARVGIEDFCEAWLQEARPAGTTATPEPHELIIQERNHA